MNMERAKLDDWGDNKLGLTSISCEYHQSADYEDRDGLEQVIKFETIFNGSDSYINISMPEGGHWSIDNKQELINLLDDFMSRFEFNKEDDDDDSENSEDK